MHFSKLLTKYCSDLSCTNTELSKKSNLNPSLLSRLKNGQKKNISKEMLKLISDALIEIASEKKVIDFPKDISIKLEKAILDEKKQDYENQLKLANNFNYLLTQLKIKNTHIAKYLTVDPSYISRIRTNERKPYNINSFIKKVSSYLISFYFNNECLDIYSAIFQIDKNLLSKDSFFIHLNNWLTNNKQYKKNSVDTFLKSIDKNKVKKLSQDEEVLNEIKNSFIVPKNKRYYGVEETKQALLDFYSLVINSNIKTDIIVYNDFPLNIYWNDRMFIKKWLLYMQIAVEKGNRIYKIHYLDESLESIFEEITTWLPLYMTKKVKPYYIEKGIPSVSSTFLIVAPKIVAITAESTTDDNMIMTRLTKKEDELNYYDKKSKSYLEIAKPLAKLFFKEDEEEYESYLAKTKDENKNYTRVINMPPNFTISDELFDKLLIDNNLSKEFKKNIKIRCDIRKKAIFTFLKNYKIIDYLSILTKLEFNEKKRKMIIARGTLDESIYYSYEDYLKHIELTKEFSKNNSNYKLIISSNNVFENIEFYIKHKSAVVVEKISDEVVSIVFENNKIIESFEKIYS